MPIKPKSILLEIQGLRAIAIIAVLLFHFFPKFFPNGFLGVDIFFVISGFLITKFLSDKDATAWDFYKRRMLRILPAITLLLTFNICAGYFLYSSNLKDNLVNNIWASAFFTNNLYLNSLNSYFSPDSKYNSLLHLWSLAVEAQFYLIAPLVMIVTRKLYFYTSILILSLSFFVWMSLTDNQIPFYSLIARLWEFCLGGIVFLLYSVDSDGFKYKSKIKNSSLALLILTILFPANIISISWQLVMYLVVCLSAACLILFITEQKRSPLLTSGTAVFIGDISYELYLWHWSILSIFVYLGGGHLVAKQIAIATVIIFAFSYISYKSIDTGIRKYRVGTVPIMVAIVYLSICYFGQNILTRPNKADHAELLNGPIKAIPNTESYESDINFTAIDAERYPLEASSGVGVSEARPQNGTCLGLGKEAWWCQTINRGEEETGKWVLYGDSKMQYLYPGFVRNLTSKSLVLIARPSCPPLNGITYNTKKDRQNLDHCENLNHKAALTIANSTDVNTVLLTFASRAYYGSADILTLQNKSVFLTFSPREYFNFLKKLFSPSKSSNKTKYSEIFYTGLKNTVSKLVRANKQVILLLDNPFLSESSECFPRKSSESLGPQGKNCVIPKQDHLKHILPLREMFLDLKKLYPSVIIVDPTEELCHPKFCSIKKDDHFLYHNGDHYSDYANDLVSRLVIDIVQNPLKKWMKTKYRQLNGER
jgi:peptidoglycan/LPS O-acetylase OafA/YrhL